jgi:hypothetical protein
MKTMDKTESLNLVESAISDVESGIEKLNQLSTTATVNRETIQKLETDLVDLRANTGNLEPKIRSSRHVAAVSTLTLGRADLAVVESEIGTQSDRVVESWRRATGLLQQVWTAVLAARKSSVEAMIEANFDVRQLHMPATHFSHAAFSVIEVEDMQNTLLRYRGRSERDAAIHDARLLRERSEPLLKMAANELAALNLVIPEATAAVAERQPPPAAKRIHYQSREVSSDPDTEPITVSQQRKLPLGNGL